MMTHGGLEAVWYVACLHGGVEDVDLNLKKLYSATEKYYIIIQ